MLMQLLEQSQQEDDLASRQNNNTYGANVEFDTLQLTIDSENLTKLDKLDNILLKVSAANDSSPINELSRSQQFQQINSELKENI